MSCYKIAVIGDSTVGKTSLILRAINNEFLTTSPTIGASFTVYQSEVEGDVKLHVWDTAGQERFRSLVPMYLRNVHAVVAIYDITSYESFHNLVHTWLPIVKNLTQTSDIKPNIYIVANKWDLVENKFNNNGYRDEIKANDAKIKEIEYFEDSKTYVTSAYTGHNIKTLFETISIDVHSKSPGFELLDPNGLSISKNNDTSWTLCTIF